MAAGTIMGRKMEGNGSMSPTQAEIEAADKILHPSWYEDDACRCAQCAVEHEDDLKQTKAALEAAERVR